MPIYEYQCSKCDEIVETIRNMTDESDELCPKCGTVMGKLISESSFYITGYAPGKAIKNAGELRKKQEKHQAEQKKKGG
jgi:putative FmdB family regulatory protein